MKVCCVLLLNSCHRDQPYKSESAQLCLSLWCHSSQTRSLMSLGQTFLFHLKNKMKMIKIQINSINLIFCDKVNIKMKKLTETDSICSWFVVFLWYFRSCNFPLVYYLIKIWIVREFYTEMPHYKTFTTSTLHLPIYIMDTITSSLLPVQPSLLFYNQSVQTPSKVFLIRPFSYSFWRILSKTHSPKRHFIILYKASIKTYSLMLTF